MKRPLFWFSISLIFGVLFAKTTGLLGFVFASLFFIAAVSYVFLWKYKTHTLLFAGVLLFYFSGAFEYMLVDDINTGKFVDLAGEQVVIKGFICSEPDIREFKINYTIKADEVSTPSGKRNIKGKVLFTALRNNESVIYEYGSKLEIRGVINIPKGPRAPGGFDYKGFLAKSGISATIFAKNDDIVLLPGKGGNAIVVAGLEIRSRIVGVLEKSLPKEQAALLNGMLIGYTKGMDEKMTGAFSDAGLTHVMAVSGMNVAFIVFPLIFLFKKMRIGQTPANFVIIGVLILFVFVTGFSPSVLRAVIMAVIMLTAQIIKRQTDVITSISFAAILLLLYNPYTLFDIGFQLSFTATLSLVLFYKYIKELLSFKHIPGFISDVLSATLAAQIGTIPITAFYFNKISIISLASNLIVVPLVEVITIIGTIMALAGQFSTEVSQVIGYVDCTFLTFILYVTKISSKVPFAVVRVVTPPLYAVFLYYVASLFFLWYKPLYKVKLKSKYYFAAFGVIAVILFINIIMPKNLEVVFFDVGEGDSTFIRTSTGKTVLIDGGGFSSRTDTRHNMGDYVVIPYLLDHGVSKLDMVIATHGHDDHIQGLKSVLGELEVKNLVIPFVNDTKDFKSIVSISGSKRIPVKMCRQNETIRLDSDTYMKVICPIEGYEEKKSPINNSSLVLNLCYKKVSVLFTGDMEKEVEDALVENGIDVDADVLKVGHHGSITSTGESFLTAVSPKAAVISVGKNNFGHPSEYILERLNMNKVHLFRTDMDGTVIMTSDGRKFKFKKTVE